MAGRHEDSLAEQETVVVGPGDRGLGADVEEAALSAVDAPAHQIGTMRADRHDWIRRRDVVASLLLGRIAQPGIRGQQLGPVERKGNTPAHWISPAPTAVGAVLSRDPSELERLPQPSFDGRALRIGRSLDRRTACSAWRTCRFQRRYDRRPRSGRSSTYTWSTAEAGFDN